MTKLKTPVVLETAFDTYTLDEILGEGGAGRVYGAKNAEQRPVAIKVLSKDKASTTKRARFRSETAFLLRNRHPNIVPVSDYGVALDKSIAGPFYVMPRFASNLRSMILADFAPDEALKVFHRILDGVEAAHLQGAVHRDLKPENVLIDATRNAVAIADFGIASFTEDLLITLVETAPTERLANFSYCAPEQRLPGRAAGQPADVYALGLMLNEMFTKEVPHGTEYKTVAQVQPQFGYLDSVIAQMLRQNPTERPASIDVVKDLLQRSQDTEVSRQRLSTIKNEVVRVGEIDDDLALRPVKIVGARWDGGQLTLTLDRPIHQGWIRALQNMGSYESVWGRGPETFRFSGKTAQVASTEQDAQRIIDFFKSWIPKATARLKLDLEAAAREAAEKRLQELAQQKTREEALHRVNSGLKF